MAEKTPAKWLHDSLLAILGGSAADLAVDERPVRVQGFLPDQAFTQRSMPCVVVMRPTKTDEGPWGRDYERRVYEATVLIIDGYRPTPGDVDVAMERVELVAEKIKAVLQRAEHRNLGLAFLHVFRSLSEWAETEAEDAGNNLVVKPMQLSVPMVLERGVVWGDAASVVVLGTEDGFAIATEIDEALEVG